MTDQARSREGMSLRRAVLDAGGIEKCGADGDVAFRWQGHPRAFVLVTQGKLTVHFRTKGRGVPWAECRAAVMQDCMPVTAALLSEREITVRARCTGVTSWLELSPHSLVLLVHGDMAFRRALFATHAKRLPTFFARASAKSAVSLDSRLADWLLIHADAGEVIATHGQIAEDLLTAREVVSRRLRSFATKGWITQKRGRIVVDTPTALTEVK
ncbi:Crp/Fnr family transcriptional regulator [Shimia sp. R11_0]|uniref:HTH crp-type domain-containing protein n=1 Tax=Shimia marina TaxID=321267 RepID=A0A0N7LRS2_9RHOB|nr:MULTISPECIES: helix-turn-helix domain-containing protein [Shimia]MBO9475998.1 Crp/Fnr family transcriptional regulator [Shimia sp. R11_0]CUH51612.1 hypothetical protein SHM7688_01050 [Shimia marina]SFD44681.1 CRP/FNR family transcriptional regulator, anaerobic regulatory protein [Shimia marina]